jgi:hypothetical protein
MLPLPREEVSGLLKGGDTRWIHRAAYDLMDYGENDQFVGMPRGRSLYGTLPSQLADEDSFANGLRRILKVRDESGVASATQVDVPAVSHRGMLVMVHELESGSLQATVLNFSQEEINGTVRSEHLTPGSVVFDQVTDEQVSEVDELQSFSVNLDAHEGMSLLIQPPPQDPEPVG